MVYLQHQGYDLEPLLETIDTPKEFLEDPSYWIDGHKIETFLQEADKQFSQGTKSIITVVGHNCATLRSWGVLDSVLRMMKQPEDMYSQPQRFLSYFISPAPPIGDSVRKGNAVSFSIPMAHDQYPLTSLFIKSALEGLPMYVDAPQATVKWRGTKIEILWSKDQVALFPDEQMERHISPDFMHSLEMVIEKTQKEVERKNKEILLKDKEIKELKEKLSLPREEEPVIDDAIPDHHKLAQIIPSAVRLRGNILRLSDYLVRAQQIVTLLISQYKGNVALQKALHRLDWEVLVREFPKVVQASDEELHYVRSIIEKVQQSLPATIQTENKTPVDLNELVENALGTLKPMIPEKVKIERQLSLHQKVSAFPKVLEAALTNILSYSICSLDGKGELRISTRPSGDHAKLEIESGQDRKGADLVISPQLGFKLREAKAILRKHNAKMTISNRPGQGAIYSIDLPVS